MEQSIPHHLIIREKTGVYYCNMLELSDEGRKQITQDGNCSLIVNENYLIIWDKKKLLVYDYDKIISEQQFINLQNVSLQKQILVIIDKIDQQQFILKTYDFPSLQIIPEPQFTLKSFKREAWPLLKFQDNYYWYIQSNKLYCFEGKQLVYSIDIGNCEYFSVQPNSPKPLVLCYSLTDFNVKESYLRIIDITGKIKYEKKLQKTSELEVLWSPNGQYLLLNKGYHEDNTGQSYFGQNQVLYFDFKTNSLKELPTYEGPVHHVQWSPSSEEFILLSGFMPSGAVMYDCTGKPLFEFGKDHKNKIIWGYRRYSMICGFGNLDGSINIWDTKMLKQVSANKYKSASLCQWSPCGRYYICAKVTPRMNVDNQYTLFNLQSQEILTKKFNELYDIQFRPSSQKFEDRPPTPIKQPQQEPPKKQFVAFVDNELAKQMRALKAGQGARELKINETFGRQPEKPQQQNFPPGYEPPKEKKKRIRKPKEQKE